MALQLLGDAQHPIVTTTRTSCSPQARRAAGFLRDSDEVKSDRRSRVPLRFCDHVNYLPKGSKHAFAGAEEAERAQIFRSKKVLDYEPDRTTTAREARSSTEQIRRASPPSRSAERCGHPIIAALLDLAQTKFGLTVAGAIGCAFTVVVALIGYCDSQSHFHRSLFVLQSPAGQIRRCWRDNRSHSRRPAWAQIGLTVRDERLRERAAHELAETVAQRLEPRSEPDANQLDCRCDVGANVKLDKLSDYVRHSANLLVECGTCPNSGVLDAVKLDRYFFCFQWNPALETVGAHLRCKRCRGRPGRIRPTTEPPDRPNWMQYEYEWGRLVKRLRNW